MIYQPKPKLGMQLNRKHKLARGLVGAWIFNEKTGETVFDLSGNGNDGTIVGADWVPDGLDFSSATSDKITAPDSSTLNLPDNLTIIQRIKWDVFKQFGVCIQKGEAARVQDFNYGIWSYQQNRIIGYFGNGAAYAAVDTGTIPSILTTGEYHDIIAVLDGTDAKIYINNIERATDTRVSGDAYQNSYDVTIGNGYSGDSNVDGIIAHTFIYNRDLSSYERAQLHRKPYAMFQQPISPASLYYEPPTGVTIPVLMHHYNQMMRA